MASGYEDPALAQLRLHQRMAEAQADRAIDLGQETAQLLKNTLRNATRSYKAITVMCVAMFAVGLALFLTSSVYGAFIAKNKAYPLAFSGLGAATFVAIFITGSIGKTQNALSNLVQVEVAFMNFFEQITLWDGYALLPHGMPPQPDPARIEKASAELQQRSADTMALLQQYTES